MSRSRELLVCEISVKVTNSSGVISEWVLKTLVRSVKAQKFLSDCADVCMTWSAVARSQLVVNFISNINNTERRGRVVNNSASYPGGRGFKSQPGDRLSWLFFVVFLSPHSNVGIVP
jgi:hypothetical protein